MRISSDPGDPDFRVDGSAFEVSVNGTKPRTIISADDVANEVVCIAYGEGGEMLHDGKNILYETIRGHVEIKRVS